MLTFSQFLTITKQSHTCARLLFKSRRWASEAMQEAGNDTFNRGVSDYEKIKEIAEAYTTKRKYSVEEAFYLIMPELWLQKKFPKVMLRNSNLPE